jgi:acyl carrier protein
VPLEESIHSIPIGRPIGNTEVYILDARLRPVPIGVAGELYIGGDGLARGYLNQPELTAEKFIPHPFRPEPGARLYRTGDRVRYLADGNIQFLDRIDNQVKIRGYRIELGEVESVLNQHPGVRHSVAMVREEIPGDKRLVAYVVAEQDAASRQDELRAYLKGRLPDYMVPSTCVVLDKLPLTTNGKVDYQRLPAPGGRPSLQEYLAPRSETERRVTAIWQALLRLDQIGVHDNFFDLGGHSLMATQIVSRLRSEFGLEIPVSAVFRFPTVNELARNIELTLWAGQSMPETSGGEFPGRVKGQV